MSAEFPKPDERSHAFDTINLMSSMMVGIVTHAAELEEATYRDPLTGLYNQRYLGEASQNAFNQYLRNDRPSSVLVADLNGFKELNDSQGHEAGDETLKKVADIMDQRVRASDVVARNGGDEFVILLTETSEEDAMHVAENIRQLIKDGSKVTASIGLSSFTDGTSIKEVIKKADQAMYKSKRLTKETGEERVISANELTAR